MNAINDLGGSLPGSERPLSEQDVFPGSAEGPPADYGISDSTSVSWSAPSHR